MAKGKHRAAGQAVNWRFEWRWIQHRAWDLRRQLRNYLKGN